MNTPIDHLDDTRALQLLTAMVRPRLRAGGVHTELPPDLRHALATQFIPGVAAEPASEGDLARQALRLLADDPAHRAALQAMLEHPPPEHFGPGESVALIAAALVVLQTHMRIERLPNGKWSLLVEKKPTSEGLLKSLVQKLLALTSTPGSK
jgi:hypothetical protein